MLDGLRDFARTWPGKILGGFLLVGLAGFGISGVLTGSSFNSIAKVGSEKITSVQFQRAYNRQLNDYAGQSGTVPTSQEAIALGIPSIVINQLASEASLNALSKKFGLGVSDERLGSLVRQDPSFSTTLGAFDPENFRSILQRSGWTEKDYFDTQKKAAMRQQLSLGIFAGVSAPKAALTLVSRYGGDKRDIEYFIVSDENMLPPADPTQAEIAKFLTDNQEAYRTETKRNIKIMVLSPQVIAKGLNVLDQEINDEYERTKANYIKIEKRTISQVALDNDIILQRFEIGKQAGETFDDLVKATEISVSELGEKTKDEILDSKLSEAAFSLKQGDFIIIDGLAGKRAIYVSSITAGGQTELAEVKEQIAERLKNRQAREIYVDVLDNIEEQRAAFKSIEDIARQFKLELKNASITQVGEGLEVVADIAPDARTKVSGAVFSAKIDSLAPSVALGANMNVWFDIISIDEARDQTIAEVGDEIKAQLLEHATREELEKIVENIVEKIKNGADFATTAVSKQYILTQANGLSRLSQSEAFSPAIINEVFSGDENHIGSAINAKGDYIVFKVVNLVANSEENIAANEFVNNSIVDSVYNSFASGLLEDAKLKINQKTLSQLLAPTNQGGYN